MTIDINGVQLAKTPFWAIDLARILNRYLEKDGRIPNDTIEFFVHESEEGTPMVSVERQCLDLDDEKYKHYYEIACEILSNTKESAIEELNSL